MTNDDTRDLTVHRPTAVAGGTILLIVGGMLLLDRSFPGRLGHLTAPFVLIVLGATMIFGRGGVVTAHGETRPDGSTNRMRRVRGNPTSGAWLIGLGAWMLVSQSHMFGLSFATSWPLLLILAGVLLVVRGLA